MGTTELNQRQDLFRNGTYLDTGVPVGTTELIQRQELSETELIQIQEYP